MDIFSFIGIVVVALFIAWILKLIFGVSPSNSVQTSTRTRAISAVPLPSPEEYESAYEKVKKSGIYICFLSVKGENNTRTPLTVYFAFNRSNYVFRFYTDLEALTDQEYIDEVNASVKKLQTQHIDDSCLALPGFGKVINSTKERFSIRIYDSIDDKVSVSTYHARVLSSNSLLISNILPPGRTNSSILNSELFQHSSIIKYN